MSKPLVVSIPHQLGKDEAVRRLKSGFGRARTTFGEKLAVIDEDWSGDHLDFRAGVLGQTLTGAIDVADDHVRVEVLLPWLMGLLVDKVRPFIERQGQLMLEKPGPGNREPR
jgi:hypothetical protein